MFKCCVCQGKTSRRTSQEEDEDDSEREIDEEDDDSSSSSSSSEDDDDEEEREIEEELAQKFKCQNPNTREANAGGGGVLARESLGQVNEEDEEAAEKVVIEVNGDVKGLRDENPLDREAIKEDVVEILNCAVKIVQEIRRGERERLEKIKEEIEESSSPAVIAAPEDAVVNEEIDAGDKPKPELEKLDSDETEENTVVTVMEEEEEEEGEYEIVEEIKRDEGALEKSKTHQIEEMIIEELINELNEEADNVQELKEIIETTNGHQDPPQANNEETETATPPVESSSKSPVDELELPPPPFTEVQIIDEIKKTEVYKIENNIRETICAREEEIVEVNVTQGVCPIEAEAVEETILDGINGDLLNIPPPVTPPPEEAADFERLDESNSELSFPTPPPIDFDVPEPGPEQEEEEEAADEELERGGLNGVPTICGPPVPPWDADSESPEVPVTADELPAVTNMLSRQDSKVSSPGSKSLPSPPSPGSETGNETEAESKSSSDEQTTKFVSYSSKTAYIERSVDDGPDEDGDDSVFEAASLAKDPEIIKDIPPRPGILAPLVVVGKADEGIPLSYRLCRVFVLLNILKFSISRDIFFIGCWMGIQN